MEKEQESPENNGKFERPIECTECRRQFVVHYTEMAFGSSKMLGMCAECPRLQKKLLGEEFEKGARKEMDTGLVCGECGTTLQEIKRGVSFGCNLCYDVFASFVLEDLFKKGECIHMGRSPGEIREIGPCIKLIALNEALDETIKREDYEQAALLRDQIRQITEIKEQERNGK